MTSDDRTFPSQSGDRVRAHTDDAVNFRLDREADERVSNYATMSPEAITQRIEELEREWDIERALEMNASTLAFVGLVLGSTVSKKFLLVPAVVLPFLFQHAVQGWCPPLPILRHFGVRSREELDAENTR
jgi:hypothetical protein